MAQSNCNSLDDPDQFVVHILHFLSTALMTMTLRVVTETDILDLLLIERAVHLVPWNREAFDTCLRAGGLGWVIETHQQLLAFIIISLHQEECHILNISVARNYQKQGLGYQLLDYVLNYAKQHGAIIVYLEVRRSNLSAIHLYKKLKFVLIGERKNYYPILDGYEDALIFAKYLTNVHET